MKNNSLFQKNDLIKLCPKEGRRRLVEGGGGVISVILTVFMCVVCVSIFGVCVNVSEWFSLCVCLSASVCVCLCYLRECVLACVCVCVCFCVYLYGVCVVWCV